MKKERAPFAFERSLAMPDRVYIEEERYDREGSERLKAAQHYLKDAEDELIDRLFSGKKVGRFGLDAYVESFAELIAAKLILGEDARGALEARIRVELRDGEELLECAAEFAEEAALGE